MQHVLPIAQGRWGLSGWIKTMTLMNELKMISTEAWGCVCVCARACACVYFVLNIYFFTIVYRNKNRKADSSEDSNNDDDKKEIQIIMYCTTETRNSANPRMARTLDNLLVYGTAPSPIMKARENGRKNYENMINAIYNY